MCIKVPKAPPLPNRPKRDTDATIVQDNRRKVREQGGVYSQIFTSPLGDIGYGENVATYGGVKRRATAAA